MSNNLKTLSKRRLPPLSSYGEARLPYSKHFKNKRDILESITYKDISESLVEEYLDNHPEFIERYMVKTSKFKSNSYSFIGNMFDPQFDEKNISSSLKSSPNIKKDSISQSLNAMMKMESNLVNSVSFIYLKCLINGFKETQTKTSIVRCLEDAAKECIQSDFVKIYLINPILNTIYCSGHYDLHKELVGRESIPLDSLQSITALAITHNRTVTYPNVDVSLIQHLQQFKSEDIIMVKPIRDFKGFLCGAIEITRKKGNALFDRSDLESIEALVDFTSVGYFFCDFLSRFSKQHEMNKYILHVTQTIFTNFRQLDSVIMDIMKYSKLIVQAQRSAFFLVDKDTNELVAKILDLGNEMQSEFVTKKNNIRFPIGVGIAGYVAQLGESLNIKDVYKDIRFNRDIDSKTGYLTNTLLAIPVKLKNEVVGVLQIVNKINGTFTSDDEEYLKTFAVYCGIALYISKMYKKIKHSEQKYKVAVDVLSYHSCYDVNEYSRINEREIPITWPELTSFSFVPWEISKEDQLVGFIFMFQQLYGFECVRKKSIRRVVNLSITKTKDSAWIFNKSTLMKFILTVQKNYRTVPYHNWNHAFCVGQSMFCILHNTDHKFDIMESIALFISCFCHDLDHRGQTNEYIKNDSLIGSLYSTSTMEHHHFQMTVSILQRKEHNIFENLNPDDYSKMLSLIRHNIIATDLNLFFKNQKIVDNYITNDQVNWEILEQRLSFMELCMTASDLSAMYKPWEKQLNFVKVIMQEFWDEGDQIKLAGQVPIKMMDRDFSYELPMLEVGFIEFVCMPCYKTLSSLLNGLSGVVEDVQSNLDHWNLLKSLPIEERRANFS